MKSCCISHKILGIDVVKAELFWRRPVAPIETRVHKSDRVYGLDTDEVRASTETTIAFSAKQIVEIDTDINEPVDRDPKLCANGAFLDSILEFGERVVTMLLGERPNLKEFRSRKAVAAFARPWPRELDPGVSF